MMKSIFAFAVVALFSVITVIAPAAPAVAEEVGGVCIKPWFGTTTKTCTIGRGINEQRHDSGRFAQKAAADAAAKASRPGATAADKERAQKARDFARSFNNEFGSRKK